MLHFLLLAAKSARCYRGPMSMVMTWYEFRAVVLARHYSFKLRSFTHHLAASIEVVSECASVNVLGHVCFLRAYGIATAAS